jgi:hypothetical protein
MNTGSTLAFVATSNITGTTSISGSGVNFATAASSNDFNISGAGATNISSALNVSGGTTFTNGFSLSTTTTAKTYSVANTSIFQWASGSTALFLTGSTLQGTTALGTGGFTIATDNAANKDFVFSGTGKLTISNGTSLSLVSGSNILGTSAIGAGGLTLNTTSTNNITVGGLGVVSINTPLFQVYDVGTNNSSFFQNVTNNAGGSIQNLRGILQSIKNGTAFESFMNNAALNGGGGIQIRTVTGPTTVTPVTLVMGTARSTTTAGTTISAVNALDILGRINFQGTDTDFRDGAYIQARASETWTTTAHGSYYEFLTIPNGSTTPVVALNIANDQSATFSQNIGCTGGINIIGNGTARIPINITTTGQTSGIVTQYIQDFSAVNTQALSIRQFYCGTIPGHTKIVRVARGSLASPSSTQNGDTLYEIQAFGFNQPAGNNFVGGSRIRFVASENYNLAANGGSDIVFLTSTNGATNATEKMRLFNSGILLIGFNAPDSPLGITRTEKLQINGTTGYNNAGSSVWNNTSDRRIKTNIAEVDDALCLIKQLKPSTFSYTEQYIEHVKKTNENYSITTDDVLYGFIAQDIEELVPSCIHDSNEHIDDIEHIKDINIHNLNIILFKAVKELAEQVDDLTARIAALEPVNEPVVPPASTPSDDVDAPGGV